MSDALYPGASQSSEVPRFTTTAPRPTLLLVSSVLHLIFNIGYLIFLYTTGFFEFFFSDNILFDVGSFLIGIGFFGVFLFGILVSLLIFLNFSGQQTPYILISILAILQTLFGLAGSSMILFEDDVVFFVIILLLAFPVFLFTGVVTLHKPSVRYLRFEAISHQGNQNLEQQVSDLQKRLEQLEQEVLLLKKSENKY